MFVRLIDGEKITAQEQREVILLAANDHLTITWSRYAAGERGPDLHVHREHTDAFYILDGVLTFAVGTGGDRLRVGAGGFVAVPPNVVHRYANEGPAESRWLNLHAPDAGFAAYMRAARQGLDIGFDQHDPPADGGRPASEAIVAGPGEGDPIPTGDRAILVKGVLTELRVAEWVLDAPYRGPERSRDGQVDAYYVVEGELDVAVGGTERRAGADTLVTVPAAAAHAVSHRSRAGTRALHVLAPATPRPPE